MTHEPSSNAAGDVARDEARIGRWLRWSLWGLGCVAVAGAAVWACTVTMLTPPRAAPGRLAVSFPAPLPAATDLPGPFVFTDVTAQAGFTLPVSNGATGEKLLPETMSGGCSVFDYDADGDPDVLLVGNASREPGAGPALQLYRNDDDCRFSEITHEAGLELPLHGMAAAAGDYDGDGAIDLFVTAVGGNRLFANRSGRYVDVTAESGVGGDPRVWSAGCGWLDFDNDGDLDLLVANYLQWTPEIDRQLDCTLIGSVRGYCRPELFAGTHLTLYRNDGAGQFRDVTGSAGLAVDDRYTGAPLAKSLAFAVLDLELDGWLDLAVFNEGTPNFLFHNQRDGTFREIGVSSGLSFDAAGSARRQFGADAAWMPESEAWDIAVGTITGEPLVYFHGDNGQFNDDATLVGFGTHSRLTQKIAPLFADFDLDGRIDVVVTSGHWEPGIEHLRSSQSHAQCPELFWNTGQPGSGRFARVGPETLGAGFSQPLVGRGSAVADFDGDGDLDLLMVANGGLPRLLRNDQQTGHRWFRVVLKGSRAVGARVELISGGRRQIWLAAPHRGYLSQSELAVTFGLGQSDTIDRLSVHWPDRTIWEEQSPPVRSTRTLSAGQTAASPDHQSAPDE